CGVLALSVCRISAVSTVLACPAPLSCCSYSIFSNDKIYKDDINNLRRYFPVLSLATMEVKYMADLVRERLQRLRQQRGLTLQGLAALAQVSPSQIWNIESGMRTVARLSLAVAKRLAVALGVSLDYLAAMDATLEALHQPAPP